MFFSILAFSPKTPPRKFVEHALSAAPRFPRIPAISHAAAAASPQLWTARFLPAPKNPRIYAAFRPAAPALARLIKIKTLIFVVFRWEKRKESRFDEEWNGGVRGSTKGKGG